MPAPTPTRSASEDFFLPELCSGSVVLVVVLIAELTAFVLTIAKHLPGEGVSLWLDLARMSLFLQWISLASSGVLCAFRPRLMRMPLRRALALSYALLLAVTLVMSEIAYQASANTGIGKELLPASHSGFVLRNLLICAIVSALVLRYFYVLHQWRSNVRREASSRFEVLQARIRPHFLFNSMNTIAALIRGRPELAERAVEDLSDLFRASLADASARIPLSEELAVTRQYAAIEELRLGERLKLDWRLDELPQDARLPRLTLQPLIENAIYHGIEPRGEGGTVSVSGSMRDGRVDIEISNPLPPEGVSGRSGRQMALENVRERLELAWPGRAGLEHGREAAGYRVRLHFPYESQGSGNTS
ncbi:MAG TPA: histidine kinase [Gammaproteobacteria bacterium]|jgi:two-component system sensor histidine kinase AlgZ|nr:histidine kinase [Gammaproteobacteria bacterium]